ncbi:MAG: hypothetical protein GY711_32340, partial [bacterium]|nr:hypothetical protein [bacterium]
MSATVGSVVASGELVAGYLLHRMPALGTNNCTAVANSTGAPGLIGAMGSAPAADNDVAPICTAHEREQRGLDRLRVALSGAGMCAWLPNLESRLSVVDPGAVPPELETSPLALPESAGGASVVAWTLSLIGAGLLTLPGLALEPLFIAPGPTSGSTPMRTAVELPVSRSARLTEVPGARQFTREAEIAPSAARRATDASASTQPAPVCVDRLVGRVVDPDGSSRPNLPLSVYSNDFT